MIVMFLDYFNTYHTQTNTGTASFLYLNPFTKAMSLIVADDFSYVCLDKGKES